MPILKDNPEPLKVEPGDAVAGMPDEIKNAPIGPMVGVAAIALNMAMKYYDINTVQDGTLYQQYKLEGRNMPALHLNMVFEAAMEIEKHLIAANRRVAALMAAALFDEIENKPEDAPEGEAAPQPDTETPSE